MAKTLDTFPVKTRKSKYPFDQWLDGQIWELTEGEDFTIPANSFRGGLYNAKNKRGVEIKTTSKTNEAGKTVFVIQAVPVTPKTEVKAETAPTKPAKKTAPAKKVAAKK